MCKVQGVLGDAESCPNYGVPVLGFVLRRNLKSDHLQSRCCSLEYATGGLGLEGFRAFRTWGLGGLR